MQKNGRNDAWKRYYNRTKSISSALKLINISTFLFFRVNKESQFFALSNHWEIMSYCLGKQELSSYIRSIIRNSMQGKISINLWPTGSQDPLINKLYKLGIGNGISLSFHFGDYVEIFSFGTDIDNHEMKNFYINHIRLLKRFVIYFRMQAKKLIHDLCCNNLIILK